MGRADLICEQAVNTDSLAGADGKLASWKKDPYLLISPWVIQLVPVGLMPDFPVKECAR